MRAISEERYWMIAMDTVRAALCLLGLLGFQSAFAEDSDLQASDRTQRVALLEAGVRAEEAIRAVKRLQHAYSHYTEAGLWSELADLLTDDVVGEFPSGTLKGKKNLRKHFMAEAKRSAPGLSQGQLHSHLIMQPIVTLGPDGTTAKGTWHEFAMLGKHGSFAAWRGGVYENDYRLDGGVWKISRIRYFEQYSGAYEEWGHKAPPKWNIPYHFEAAHVGVTIPESALRSLRDVSATGSLDMRLAGLAQRLQQLDDETQVRNLQHIYGYYLDRKMWDDVADLFTEEGTFEVARRGVYVGKARIRRALEVLYGGPRLNTGELFDHIILATVVTIAPDGRSAGARSTQLSMLGRNGEYAMWQLGTYENEFVKENGVWKISAVRFYPRMTTDYDAGWAHDARPAPGAHENFPPDRPSQPYESYPKVYTVGFHFPHPVTGKPVRYPSNAVVPVPLIAPEAGSQRVSTTAAKEANVDEMLMSLERKLDAAIAVDAVENLNSAYGYYIDESAWDAMADTFASTGSKEITGAGVYVGPDRIRKVLNLRGPRGGRTPGFFTIHQLTQPVIHIAEDGNSAHARLRLFQCGGNADGSSGSWIGGIYENTAIKENGEWKFGRQELYHNFNASYRNGWARVGGVRIKTTPDRPRSARDVPGGGITQGLGGAASGPKVAQEFPPDRPIKVRQYAFPEIVEPPFHYTNPVSGRMPPEMVE